MFSKSNNPVRIITQLKGKVKERVILGIDPGTNITGYGVIRVAGTNPELVTIGFIDLSKFSDHYIKLKHIFDRITGIIDEYHPDELAIEAPFYGKNVQSMLKLGRAQGAAIAAALLVGFWGATNEATVSLSIHDQRANKMIWNFDHKHSSSLGSPARLVDDLMRQASREMPYFTGVNFY